MDMHFLVVIVIFSFIFSFFYLHYFFFFIFVINSLFMNIFLLNFLFHFIFLLIAFTNLDFMNTHLLILLLYLFLIFLLYFLPFICKSFHLYLDIQVSHLATEIFFKHFNFFFNSASTLINLHLIFIFKIWGAHNRNL